MLHNIFNRHINMSENNSNRRICLTSPTDTTKHLKQTVAYQQHLQQTITYQQYLQHTTCLTASQQTHQHTPNSISKKYINMPLTASPTDITYLIASPTYPLQYLQKIHQYMLYSISNRHINIPLTASPKNISTCPLQHLQQT